LIGLTSHKSKREEEANGESNHAEKDKYPENPKKKNERGKGKRKDDILQFLYPAIDWIEVLAETGITVVAYLRVSTVKQAVEGKSLQAQENELRAVAKRMGAARIIWLVDAGKSGRDFSGRKLSTILALAAAGRINKLIVSEIDRVGRKSLKLLGFLLQLRSYDVIIVTPTGELDLEKLSDFIVTTAKAFGAEEQNDNRGYYALRSKVETFRHRRWNLDIPKGFQKKGRWIEKIPGWDAVISQIFKLFIKYENYALVTNIVNDQFKNFLEKPLTRQQVRQILENPIYIGKPQYSGEVVEKKFGKVVISDPHLAYVTEDLFEKAKTIIKAKYANYSPRKKPIEELVETFGPEVLDFLPNVAVLCPRCKTVMKGNGGSDYICPRDGSHLNPLKKTELQRIREWFFIREKGLRVLVRLLKKYKRKGKKLKDADIERLLKENKKDDGNEGEEENG
jgi:DNA invertase Pin-like site-specific DNA recombinase